VPLPALLTVAGAILGIAMPVEASSTGVSLVHQSLRCSNHACLPPQALGSAFEAINDAACADAYIMLYPADARLLLPCLLPL
jgi:hypothetical protein